MPEGAPPLSSLEGLRELWDCFRAGGTVGCPTEGSPMALSVDGSAGIYRFVCTRCGTASVWFESGTAGMALRTGPGKASPNEEG